MRAYSGSKLLAIIAGVLALGTSLPAFAQDTPQDEEIIVTGTRTQGTSPTQSMSPVDVLGVGEIADQASSNLTDQLTAVAPSINTQRFPIADGTAVIRPVNLRNLPPDSTLVLVNGSRRHRSALVNLQAEPFGTVNQGAQAVDFGLIPSIAIKRIEVLRDGASAQYGSDAIAGVINVILRDDNDGLDISSQYGKMYEDDGENFNLGFNTGITIGNGGFLDIAADYLSSDITSRGSARPDAAAVAAAVGRENVPFNGLGQRWGDPHVEMIRAFANAELPFTNFTLYGHASVADERTYSGFFYRAPFGVTDVEPRNTLCVCTFNNVTHEYEPNDTPQTIVNNIVNAGLDPNDYLTADASSPSGFVSLNPIYTRFPGGYNPTFGADILDYAGVLGLRGELGNQLSWDLSARYARNELSYFLKNTINPSLGINSPLEFSPGDLTQEESGINLDFVMPWNVGLATPVNVAFGAEWRNETYTIDAGDLASYTQGPTATLFTFGSDGFQGDAPSAAGEFGRDSWAVYLDTEAELTDRINVGLAGRYESYDDFGDNFSWKVSGRWEPIDGFALRGTVSTGFRAPTPGQINTLDVTTTADSSGALILQGTFPVESPVAVTLGAEPLDPEESVNITLGAVWAPSRDLTFTFDVYQIDVDDRIALLNQSITAGSPEDTALINAGFPGVRSAGFFANAFDTRVRGVEIAATKAIDLGSMGNLTLDARYSWNEQEIRSVKFANINPETLYDYENQLPSNRAVVTANYDYNNRWGGFVRANYYDGWQDLTFGELGRFDAKILVDAEAHVNLNDHVELAVGADNIFDERPDAETNSVLRFLGATSPISSPFGFNGGAWYVRLRAHF